MIQGAGPSTSCHDDLGRDRLLVQQLVLIALEGLLSTIVHVDAFVMFGETVLEEEPCQLPQHATRAIGKETLTSLQNKALHSKHIPANGTAR